MKNGPQVFEVRSNHLYVEFYMNSYHEKPDLDGVLCYDIYDYYLLPLICISYLYIIIV